MIFWIILFAVIVFISFLLALRSMADFEESPTEKKHQYSLYLIRNSQFLNKAILDSVHKLILKDGLLISLERLIKGGESALVVYGPQEILRNFEVLNLLELEDYTGIDPATLQAWEIGVRKQEKIESIDSFFKSLPRLSGNEQLWWQLVLKAENSPGENKFFQGQIRLVTSSVLSEIKNPTANGLTKVPKPFTKEQVIGFYQKRSFIQNKYNPILGSKAVLELLALV